MRWLCTFISNATLTSWIMIRLLTLKSISVAFEDSHTLRQDFWNLLVLIMKLNTHIDFSLIHSNPTFDAMSCQPKPQKSGLNFNNSAYSVRNKNIVGIFNVYSFKAVPNAFLLWFREVIQQMPSVCIYTRLQKSFHYAVFGPTSPLHCFPLHYSHYSNDKIPLKIHIMHLLLMKSK